MKKNTLNIWLIIIMMGLFSLNFTPVFAQQMLVQILGGGYRLDGPTTIDFPDVTAKVTAGATSSERKTSEIADINKYIEITDENGGNPFTVTITTSGDLTNIDRTGTITTSNFYVKNDDGSVVGGITTINGRDDGLGLNSETNSYADMTTTRSLADGTGQAPGEWRIYPQFKIDVDPATAIGNYETTVTFTII